MGVVLRFLVAAFTIMTLTLVVAVGVSAGSRSFGTTHGSALLSGQLGGFVFNGTHKDKEDKCPPQKKKHHKATKPHECDNGDDSGD